MYGRGNGTATLHKNKKDAWGITQSSEKSLIPSIKMYAVELQ
jgi:hypothetical protein